MRNKQRISLFFIIAPLLAGCQIDAPCNRDELYNDEGLCVKCQQYFDASDNGYHFDEDKGGCIIDSDDECGDGMINCMDMPNVKKTHCSRGKCVVDNCVDGYSFDDELNKCMSDNDRDLDGVTDDLDPCPDNHTKWKDTWWTDENKTEGIRCDFRDTDGDGFDDSEDDCFTNPNRHDGCDQSENKDVCCGLKEEKTEGDSKITYYNIYNAMDLYNLLREDKLRPPKNISKKNSFTACNDNDNHVTSCDKLGRCVVFSCGTCTDGACEDYELDSKIHVVLKKDINLDDIYDYDNNVSTYVNGNKCALNGWIPAKMQGVSFGNGESNEIMAKIYYQRANQVNPENSIRCTLPNALFESVISSVVKSLKMDIDMKGNGRALFANIIMDADSYKDSIGMMKSLRNSVRQKK